jgi:MerR family transcriptional regulator, heat shock protein HspR
MTKRKSKGAYMISAVAEMYGIHPQTLRLYEREGLLKPSRTEGNTRLYTDEDLQRLEFILSLARDLGVNISGMAIILQMRERMEEMQRQIQEFVQYIQQEVLTRASAAADPSKGAIVPVRRKSALHSFYVCHPERSITLRNARRNAESKDPYQLHETLHAKGCSRLEPGGDSCARCGASRKRSLQW